MARNCKTGYEASIMAGALYFEDVKQCSVSDEIFAEILDDKHLKAVRLVSLSANYHLALNYGAYKVNEKLNMEMTLRKERRGQLDHWYAYRRVFGKLHKRYVGSSEQITEARLLDVAQKMPSL